MNEGRMTLNRENVVNEFFDKYKKTRHFIFSRIKGFQDEKSLMEFTDNLILQTYVIWFLQIRGFFNRNSQYLITKFQEIVVKKTHKKFKNFFEFFTYFLDRCSLHTDSGYYEDEYTGEITTCNPAILLEKIEKFKEIFIPDECFYQFECSSQKEKQIPKSDENTLPILNLFENQNWMDGKLDEFVFGAIYEKLMTHREKKRSGAYYTPKKVTEYASQTVIELFIINNINREFNTNYKLLDSFFQYPDKNKLLYLFNLISNIKILDPAVGTAHFLESCIKYLIEIHVKIWSIFRKMNLKGGIEVPLLTKESPRSINLLEITNLNEFRFFVMYFIIIRKNIYGVDINFEAIKVAKARIFLVLVRFFDFSKSYPIQLSEVFLNLRWGNTLLGYDQVNKIEDVAQKTLDSYIVTKKKISWKNDILDDELRNYILRAAKFLDIENFSLNELDRIYYNFNSENLSTTSINQYLKLLATGYYILHFSIEPKYIVSLKNLLDTYTKQLSEALTYKYASEFEISVDQLQTNQIFHWISEFPQVFADMGGFDIVIANPPYLGESGNKLLFRMYARVLPAYYEGKMDFWYFFFHRSLDLMVNGAYSSLVCSNYWITATGAAKLRIRMLEETRLLQYINFGENKVFSNAQGVHINIIIFEKSKTPNKEIECILFDSTYSQVIDLFDIHHEQLCFNVNQKKIVFKPWDSYFHFLPPNIHEIIDYIVNSSIKLKLNGFYVKEGIVTGLNNISTKQINKYSLDVDWKGIGVFILDEESIADIKVVSSLTKDERRILKPFFKNSDIRRFSTETTTSKNILYLDKRYADLDQLPNVNFHLNRFKIVLTQILDNPPYINRPRTKEIFTSSKIVTPQRSIINTFAYNSIDWYAGQDVYYILEDKNNREKLKLLLLILNSNLAYFWFYWMGKRKGKQLELFGEPLGLFPLPQKMEKYLTATILSDYLMFLFSIKNSDPRIQEIRDYLEKDISNCLVNELFLREKLSAENYLSNDDPTLLDYISENFSPINYEYWSVTHYKKPQKPKFHYENRENVEKRYLTLIEESYKQIRDNSLISDYLVKLKAHPWVEMMTKQFDLVD